MGDCLAVLAVPTFDELKTDDVVGALSVHLICGTWVTLAVPFADKKASFPIQLLGVVAIGSFVTVSSPLVWLTLKHAVGIRVSEEGEECAGSDTVKLGLEAYPEFCHFSSWGTSRLNPATNNPSTLQSFDCGDFFPQPNFAPLSVFYLLIFFDFKLRNLPKRSSYTANFLLHAIQEQQKNL